ncbi:alpha/beta hydrolase [Conexibacter sp. JD483]|uniref:alpha/beta fold hydrolase n=1 Tax=unclassified Conexibacter TaxID=2627773 RepID=UPI0027219018|nr:MULTISPECIES: alpha/beta hydrolase [unclassified Conexibacter]MDO8188340.1 alpha/beta hydrolase [Conexibacter sp. CPCC 205706]MDO8200712.1 alpha/beta hydrolase [Conexibacter sp. CPCC 205762]MDR9369436.1 alpha/beta hydrolase [Conexibacter sp. JD483]
MSDTEALNSTLIETALGPVEHAVLGDGPPVLVVHGSPGGIDAAEIMARFLVAAGRKAILLSRPGYLGSELGDRTTIDQQADLLAALLDALAIERAGVLAWSGGGPSSYRLAVRHPQRVSGLVVCAGVSHAIEEPQEPLSDKLMFSTRPGAWLLRLLQQHAPERLISATLGSEGDLTKEELSARTAEVFADPVKRAFVVDLGGTVIHRDRQAGLDNDWAQFGAIADLELERVSVPTLLVQGSADSDVVPEHSAFAAAKVPGAELLTLDRGTHLAFWTHPESDAAQARALAVLG